MICIEHRGFSTKTYFPLAIILVGATETKKNVVSMFYVLAVVHLIQAYWSIISTEVQYSSMTMLQTINIKTELSLLSRVIVAFVSLKIQCKLLILF